jgi:hypothetical protein
MPIRPDIVLAGEAIASLAGYFSKPTAVDPQETFVPRQRMVGPARKRSFAPDRRPCLRQDHVSSSSSAFASFRSAVSKPSVNQP